MFDLPGERSPKRLIGRNDFLESQLCSNAIRVNHDMLGSVKRHSQMLGCARGRENNEFPLPAQFFGEPRTPLQLRKSLLLGDVVNPPGGAVGERGQSDGVGNVST